MEAQDILNFKNSLADMSLEDLESMAKNLSNQINQMILNSDLIMKVAIVDQRIKEKKGEADGKTK